MHAAIAVVLATALALGPERVVSDPEAAALVEEAQAAFEQGDYATASQKIEQAYLVDPVPQLLWPWAQAERAAGNCKVAIDLYQKFIESGPRPEQVEAAEQNIARCEEESGPGEPPPPPPPAPPGGSSDFAQPEPTPAGAPSAKPDAPKEPKREWWKDPLGTTLVAGGGALVILGIGLAGGASARSKKVADEAGSMSEYDDRKDGTTAMRNAGVAVLSIGVALAVGGAVRWALVARKNKRAEQAAIAPWIGPHGAGAGAVVRF